MNQKLNDYRNQTNLEILPTEFTNSKFLLEAIQQRRSIRNYSDKPIAQDILEKIEDYVHTKELMLGPFGNNFKIIVLQKRMGEISGTYGFIRNPPAVLVGVATYEKYTLFELGYVFQGLVLYLVSLGLQTCWVGASFSHDDIAKASGLKEDEIVPAIAFFGYQKENKNGGREKHLIEKVISFKVKPEKRHTIEEFGFLHDFSKSLTEKTAGIFAGALNVAKLSPSAQNFQSWRVVVADDSIIHFYVEKKLTNKVGEGNQSYACPPEYIENGIFAKHFALYMEDKDIEGKFLVTNPNIPRPNKDFEYMVSWKMS